MQTCPSLRDRAWWLEQWDRRKRGLLTRLTLGGHRFGATPQRDGLEFAMRCERCGWNFQLGTLERAIQRGARWGPRECQS